MATRITVDGNDYYIEGHWSRGFRGGYYSPPEEPEPILTSVEDENGTLVREDEFDRIESQLIKQLYELPCHKGGF